MAYSSSMMRTVGENLHLEVSSLLEQSDIHSEQRKCNEKWRFSPVVIGERHVPAED